MKRVALIAAFVSLCAGLSLPLGNLLMPIAAGLVLLGLFLIIPGATELSGRFLGIGMALAIVGTLWAGVATQLRQFLVAALHQPVIVAALAALFLGAVVALMAKGLPRLSRRSGRPKLTARTRAALHNPELPPRVRSQSQPSRSTDDLGLFG